jgi:hypothetical protein
VARQLVVAGLAEELSDDTGAWALSAQRHPGGDGSTYPGVIHPHGHAFLESFVRYPFPRHAWQAGPHRLERRVIMIHGRNAVLLSYERCGGSGPCDWG